MGALTTTARGACRVRVLKIDISQKFHNGLADCVYIRYVVNDTSDGTSGSNLTKLEMVVCTPYGIYSIHATVLSASGAVHVVAPGITGSFLVANC